MELRQWRGEKNNTLFPLPYKNQQIQDFAVSQVTVPCSPFAHFGVSESSAANSLSTGLHQS